SSDLMKFVVNQIVNGLSFWPLLALSLIILYSCTGKNKSAENEIISFSDSNPEMPILNWRLIGTYNDTTNAKSFKSALFKKLNLEDHDELILDTFYAQQEGYVIDFDELFRLDSGKVAYALANIKSKRKADVALMCGVDGGIRLWINGKLHL